MVIEVPKEFIEYSKRWAPPRTHCLKVYKICFQEWICVLSVSEQIQNQLETGAIAQIAITKLKSQR
jgi:hypothetical protein